MDELNRLIEFYGRGQQGEQLIFDSYLRKLHRHEIPESYPGDFFRPSPFLEYYRRQFVMAMGHVLTAKCWVRPLAGFIGGGRVLEVMSGTGALAMALSDEGVDVTATDDYSWRATFTDPWTKVVKKSAVPAVKRLGRDADFVLMSWPPMDDTGAKVLEAMRAVNPDCRMIYIGEGRGGCTANHSFFDLMKPAGDIPGAGGCFTSWYGVDDGIYLVK